MRNWTVLNLIAACFNSFSIGICFMTEFTFGIFLNAFLAGINICIVWEELNSYRRDDA